MSEEIDYSGFGKSSFRKFGRKDLASTYQVNIQNLGELREFIDNNMVSRRGTT